MRIVRRSKEDEEIDVLIYRLKSIVNSLDATVRDMKTIIPEDSKRDGEELGGK